MENEKRNLSERVSRIIDESSARFFLGAIKINDALCYHVSHENDPYPNQVHLHVYKMKIGKSYRERKDALRLFESGLHDVALRLRDAPELSHVTSVSGSSKLIFEHPLILEHLGFDIIERDEKAKNAVAIMSRDEFIQKFAGLGT